MSELKNNIMVSIEKNEVKMRSKKFFMIIKALSEIGITALVLLVVFLINLSFYLPRKGMGLGPNRWNHILSIIPWWIVILGVLGIGILVWILYRYTGAYKKRLTWIIGIVSILVVLAGFLLSVTSFNETVGQGLRRMQGNHQNIDGGQRNNNWGLK